LGLKIGLSTVENFSKVIYWRELLLSAALVIPAPKAYIKAVDGKRLVVELWPLAGGQTLYLFVGGLLVGELQHTSNGCWRDPGLSPFKKKSFQIFDFLADLF
jgi:hypothetical protein